MRETTAREPRTPLWQWPREWMRDEKFWRDVASRTASGLIVLFVGYWTALLIGFVKTPDNFRASYQVTLGGLLVVETVWWHSKLPFSRLRRFFTFKLRRLPFAAVLGYAGAIVVETVLIVGIAFFAAFLLRVVFNVAAQLLGIDARI